MSDKKDDKTPPDAPPGMFAPIQLADDSFAKKYPLLWFCLAPKYVDGKLTKQEGSFRISSKSSLWTVSIESPTEKRQCEILLTSLDDVLGQVEKMLGTGRVVWAENWKSRKRGLSRLDRDI